MIQEVDIFLGLERVKTFSWRDGEVERDVPSIRIFMIAKAQKTEPVNNGANPNQV